MEGEDSGQRIPIDTGKPTTALTLGEGDDANDKEGIEQQYKGTAYEALLLADGTEDKVGVLLGHIVELGLRAIEEPLAPQAARPDGYLRLVDVIAYALEYANLAVLNELCTHTARAAQYRYQTALHSARRARR